MLRRVDTSKEAERKTDEAVTALTRLTAEGSSLFKSGKVKRAEKIIAEYDTIIDSANRQASQRSSELDERERRISEREHSLAARERKLSKREKEQSDKETELNKRKAIFEKIVSCAVFQQVEEAKADLNYIQAVKAHNETYEQELANERKAYDERHRNKDQDKAQHDERQNYPCYDKSPRNMDFRRHRLWRKEGYCK